MIYKQTRHLALSCLVLGKERLLTAHSALFRTGGIPESHTWLGRDKARLSMTPSGTVVLIPQTGLAVVRLPGLEAYIRALGRGCAHQQVLVPVAAEERFPTAPVGVQAVAQGRMCAHARAMCLCTAASPIPPIHLSQGTGQAE